jgi:ribose transport system ATP-binding protein
MSAETPSTSGSPVTDQLLRLENISKGFPGVQALSGVHLDVDAGEVHAVVGENGAGKSTLMKVLAGIHQPDGGTIWIGGDRVEVAGPQHAQRLGVSIIHQELSLMPDLTIAENIYIGRERRRGLGLILDDGELNRRTTALFQRLGISLDPKTKAGDLLVAQQQVVEIAKALSFDARVIIMDEPTAALTTTETEMLFALIGDLKSRGTAIIYISHRLEELRAISDRITVLRDGSYVDTLITADTDLRHVISLMVGRQLKVETRPTVPSASQPPVLEVRGLTTEGVLHDVTFDLRRGEILGFAGLMGAGRTEVARAICGADPFDDGRIIVHGAPVKINNPADAARHGIGYLSEDRRRFGLMLDQDVGFNILISSIGDRSGIAGFVRDRDVQTTSRQYIEFLKIKTPSMHEITKNLSGGNQQKVVIAKWLAKDCDILIFDEPTRGIDVGAKEEIYDLLETLVANGKAVIMISSELPEVLRMSHRIAVMCEGRITGILDNSAADQETVMDYATRAGSHGGITS